MKFKLGDRIRCPSFAKGQHPTAFNDGILEMNTAIVHVCRNPNVIGWTEHQTKEGGWSRDVEHRLDARSYDDSRGTAEYLIINAVETKGGRGHGMHDWYPGAEHYKAMRIGEDRRVDESAPIVCFTLDYAPDAALVE